jgi:hypothetical protein
VDFGGGQKFKIIFRSHPSKMALVCVRHKSIFALNCFVCFEQLSTVVLIPTPFRVRALVNTKLLVTSCEIVCYWFTSKYSQTVLSHDTHGCSIVWSTAP